MPSWSWYTWLLYPTMSPILLAILVSSWERIVLGLWVWWIVVSNLELRNMLTVFWLSSSTHICLSLSCQRWKLNEMSCFLCSWRSTWCWICQYQLYQGMRYLYVLLRYNRNTRYWWVNIVLYRVYLYIIIQHGRTILLSPHSHLYLPFHLGDIYH